jgi:hypothetical protein
MNVQPDDPWMPLTLMAPLSLHQRLLQQFSLLVAPLGENESAPPGAPAPAYATPAAPEPAPTEPIAQRWSVADLAELKGLVANLPTAVALFDLCCAKTGMPYGFEQARARVGRSESEGRADLATMTRIIHKRFGQDRGWPLRWSQENGKGVYRANNHVAAVWNAKKAV